jgi:hypothetical protein
VTGLSLKSDRSVAERHPLASSRISIQRINTLDTQTLRQFGGAEDRQRAILRNWDSAEIDA